MSHTYSPIGYIQSCYNEKFGTPRQSLMAPSAKGILKLNNDPALAQGLLHLEGFSHIWVIFVFHAHLEKAWHPLIEPPRVEGPAKVGVFASRSPHRPNAIGLSVVALEGINAAAPGGSELTLGGIDLLDGTPVLDIKPYLPYADRVPGASSGWAEGSIERFEVSFSREAEAALFALTDGKNLQRLIGETLQWDPRPTPQRASMPISSPENEGRIFGLRISGHEVKWQIREKSVHVVSVGPA